MGVNVGTVSFNWEYLFLSLVLLLSEPNHRQDVNPRYRCDSCALYTPTIRPKLLPASPARFINAVFHLVLKSLCRHRKLCAFGLSCHASIYVWSQQRSDTWTLHFNRRPPSLTIDESVSGPLSALSSPSFTSWLLFQLETSRDSSRTGCWSLHHCGFMYYLTLHVVSNRNPYYV